jgi:myo-inositol-1(or 4)-monophosphatase
MVAPLPNPDPMPVHSADLSFVIATSRAAGALIREHYGKVERQTKRGEEAVTDADRASQRLIIEKLSARFPDDGFIGEENDDGSAITNRPPKRGARVWVIDPIDGTNNFVARLGNFAVCIGLLDAGMPVLGVVYDVCRDEVYAAEQGHGAWLNDCAITAPTTPLSERCLLMLTSNLLDAQGRMPAWAAAFHAQTRLKVRVLGSAALEAVQVAAGVAHGSITVNGKLWDIAAAAAVVVIAGGEVLTPSGQPLFPFSLHGYSGAKTPYVAVGTGAKAEIIAAIKP